MSTSPPEPLTVTTTALHTAALTAAALPPYPPPTHPLTPPPSSIPHSKLIPKTRFIVDGFKHADPNFSAAYFLSHFHSDHYTGLTPQWTKGIIYCSDKTARLLHQILLIPKPFIHSLPLSQPVLIDGIEVSLVDANHCPGAVQLLFKVPDEGNYVSNVVNFSKYVHTGDFRYCAEMKNEQLLCDFVGADAVFLDTTYCNPKFVFPSQEESIEYVVSVIDEKLKGGGVEKVLFLVATYVIGKEKILLEIARRCKRKVHVSSRKMEVLRALGLGEGGVFTEDELESDVHVVSWNVLGETWPYFRPNFVKMKEIMSERGYTKVVGFVPTGWTYEVKKNKFSVRTKDSFEIHLVPYSEHSNYDELREYVKFLKPKHVIPTVGADVEKIDSKHAHKMQKHFAGLVDEMAVKQKFLMGFTRGDSRDVHETVKMDDPLLPNIGQMQEDKDALFAGVSCSDTKLGSEMKCSLPQEGQATHDTENLRDSDLEKSVEELQDCLPSWVTQSQMLTLLRGAGGNVVEAVSNFFEHETEFHEEVLPSTSLCASQEGSEIYPSLPFESTPIKNVHHKEDVSLTECLKFSSSPSLISSQISPGKRTSSQSLKSSQISPGKRTSSQSSKSSRISPGKRKRNLDSKGTKRARADSSKKPSDSKQHSITKFFSKKAPVIVEDNKVQNQNESEHSNIDQSASPTNTSEPYKEETEKFIQIVNGAETLRGYAATIIEKAHGDINTALDIYYSDNTNTPNEIKHNSLESNKLVESECTSRDEVLPESKEVEIEPDMRCPAPPKDDLAGNYVSLPPERYSPIEHACWKKGQPAPYIHIARTFDLVEEEKGRLKATSMLCNMFRSLLALSPDDVLPAVYLCTNKIAPDHENTELNIGGSIVVGALEEVCGTTKSRITNLYNTHGDLGDVAQLCRQTQSLLAPPAVLTIQGVYSVLRKISVQTGSGSTVRKKRLIMNLMCSCREKEMKFVVRTLVRNLRIGAMMRSVLPALAQAIAMNSSDEQVGKDLKDRFQNLSSSVVEAYNIVPNLDLLIPCLLEKGVEFSLSTFSIVPGVPMKPMLAKITNGASQVMKLLKDKAFTCEYKYDGQRAQIHRLADGSVRVFSRNGDETTSRFPDLIEIVKDSCAPTAVTFIIDAEVVAIDRTNCMKLMSFQELSSRERGSKDSLIAMDKIKVDICIFVFDVMFANGKQLLDLPLRKRRTHFTDLFNEEKPGYFEYAKEMTVESRDADASNETTLNIMSNFLEDALKSSCEGIMVKCLDVDAGYTPSKRSDAWLKVKRDYVEGLSDSLDLVPIGAWHGNGRKAGWFSPFLMACYNPDTEEYQSVCRVMSGFSDAFYREMKEFFSGDKILAKKPVYYQTAEVADMWFSPEVVWQIKGADFTVSPVHHAAIGLVHSSRGISVRFPRFIRTVTDRTPEECSTSSEIADMFSSQTRKMDVNVKK